MDRRVYLEDVPLATALERWLEVIPTPWSNAAGAAGPGVERVPTREALGRVTAEAVFALRSNPHFDAAAMDGYAVAAADTFGAGETAPVRLKVGVSAHPVDTGDPMPPGTDAVVMIEDVQQRGDEIELIAAAYPWQHVRAIGEDSVESDMLVPSGHRLRPQDLAAALAAGVTEIAVVRRPRVAVFPTGAELVDAAGPVRPGEIPEFNSAGLAAAIHAWGGEPDVQPITRDDRDLLLRRLEAAARDHDLLVVNAGSSAGREDFTASAIERLGRVLVHGVAVRPGKPTILGVACGRPVIGLPGYPVTAMLMAELFLCPALHRLQGLPAPERPTVTASLTRPVTGAMGSVDFLRVKVGRVGTNLVATPVGKGAGAITSLVRADGIARLGEGVEALPEGSPVAVQLLRPLEEIERTLVCSGSHDLLLDLLGDLLRRRYPDRWLSSSHVGSQAGILALRRGEAHLAGVHLLDPATGEYNVSYVRRYLPGRPAVLFRLARREQGLLVPRGNPLGLRSFADLARPGLRYVNRQRGSGTRVLLDYHLGLAGIDPASISGYEHEAFTHTAVAATVAAGSADTGLAIRAVADSFGLDFVPLAEECYDLLIPLEHYQMEEMQALLALARSPEWRERVRRFAGYDLSDSGLEIRVDAG